MFIADNSACQPASGLPANAFLPASLLASIGESVPQSAPSPDLASIISQAFDDAIRAYNEGRINAPEAYADLGPNIVRDVANTNARGAGGPASGVAARSDADAVCVVAPGDAVHISPLQGGAPNRARPSLRTEQGLLPPATPPKGLAGFGGALSVTPYGVSCETADGTGQGGGISPWWFVAGVFALAAVLSNGRRR